MIKSTPLLLRLNEDDASFPNRTSFLAFASIVSLFVAARLWRLTDSCLWFDEIFSRHAARYGWGRMMEFVAADLIHPPLFYALLKVWIGIGGDSLLWLRLFPALISIAAILPFYLLCRGLSLSGVEMNLALLLLAVNGYLIKYAQELRMYSLLLFLTLCSLWLFVRFFNNDDGSKRRLFALFVVNLLLVYTHYYGWLVIAVEALFLLLRGRRKLPPFLITVALLLICFSPWAYAVMTASEQGRGLEQNIGWVTRPRLPDLAQYLTLLNEPFYFRQSTNEPLYHYWSVTLALLLFGLPLLALIWHIFSRRRHDDDEARLDALRWLAFFSFSPLALALSLSWVLPHSIWGARHLIIVAAPYSMLTAIALIRLRPYWIKVTIFLLFGCWLLLAGAVLLLMRQERYIWCAWNDLARQAVKSEPVEASTIKLYAFEDLVAYHLWFSLEEAGSERFKVAVIKGIPGLHEDPAYFLPRSFDEVTTGDISTLNEDDIWIAFRDTAWNEDRPPLKTLKERGYQVKNLAEAMAQGQRAFLVHLVRGTNSKDERMITRVE
jgi:Dolichyl-phosphate-mannose-protein mannosyltransferase